MVPPEKFEIIQRYLSNECSEQERKMVENWMQNDPDIRNEIQLLRTVWNAEEKPLANVDVDADWQQFRAGLEKKETKSVHNVVSIHAAHTRVAYKVMRYAAVFIFALFLSYFLTEGYSSLPWNSETQIAEQINIIKVENGQRKTITLPDNSTVTLDAGSELKYSSNFLNDRLVELSGEGFFKVTHNPEKPFRVQANHGLVKVLGTEFNVRAWDIDSKVSVVVQSGKVSFKRKDESDGKTVYLTKGKYSSLALEGEPQDPEGIDVSQYLKWMQNDMNFENASVAQIFDQLHRWYGFEFKYDDETMLEERLSVHVKQSNVDDVLNLIAILTDSQIERVDTSVNIQSYPATGIRN